MGMVLGLMLFTLCSLGRAASEAGLTITGLTGKHAEFDGWYIRRDIMKGVPQVLKGGYLTEKACYDNELVPIGVPRWDYWTELWADAGGPGCYFDKDNGSAVVMWIGGF